jgi:sugar/nucleoside kinase (ribokinase family)
MTALSIVAIGDIFVDCISDLTAPKYQEVIENVKSSTNIFASVDVQVGGAGLQFAVAAKAAGFEISTLIGKIGGRLDKSQTIVPDLPGNLAIEYLQQHGVHPLLVTDPESETGRIIIIFLPNDRRLMLSDRLANTLFTSSDISPEMKLAVRNADLVHVSGYTFLQESRRVAMLELMRYAREGSGKIALDFVPHDLYKYISFAQLCSDVGGLVDWIIVEIPTAHQLVGLGRLKQISPDVINHIQLLLTSTFPSIALFLNPGYAIIIDENERLEYKFKYQPGITSRGQSARAQAELLYWRLNR